MTELMNYFLAILPEDDANSNDVLRIVFRMHNALQTSVFTSHDFHPVARSERYFPIIPFGEDNKSYNANHNKNTNNNIPLDENYDEGKQEQI